MPTLHNRFAIRFLLSLSSSLLIAITGAVFFLSRVHAEVATATYTHGSLSITIPYHSALDGAGNLTSEILDPEDHVLSRSERKVRIGKGDGSWEQVITPARAISYEDIIWQRVRYRFEYSDGKLPAIEGVESISEILRRPVVRILGQSEYLAGSGAAIRVIVSDANENPISPSTIQSGSVRIELLIPGSQPRPLFTGRLNRRGTVEAQFRFPADLTGKFDLHYVADTPIGSAEYTQPIELAEKASILLTTEKPIYQPGQTIHVRALALDRADHKASADKPLSFDIEDSRGNKVFKKITSTDGFGIASAEFSLADEVNLGTYHLRALMGDPNAPSNTAEIALSVERYVLPKFKVEIEFTEKDGKPRSHYKPGDRVTGSVRANYFFGKPVDRAEITIKASAMDVELSEAASASGKTDGDGVYHFDLKLPEYFAGKPLSQGAARALVEATVKDSAAHSETRGEPITISESSILLTAVPEGGSLVPHLENQVYLLSSYPDGRPASTTMTVHINHQHDRQVTTDSSGVAVVRFNPGDGLDSFHIDADDHQGNRASTTVPLETREGTDQVLLRADHAILKTGDPLHLKVLSTRTTGSAYVDVVKNGQTILTRDLDLQNGEADLNLTATPEMAGTLDIDAYIFGRDAQPVADHRIVFVQPADELKIETATNAAVYKPGSDATIRFHVTNSHGEGVSAALGLQMVDEAVFALAEKQPGFAKVFFYLEQEVMKPRYEIHSLSMPEILHTGWHPRDKKVDSTSPDLAAQALFSATEMANPAKLDTEFGRTLPTDRFAEYQQRYRTALVEQVKQIVGQIDQKHTAPGDFATTFDRASHRSDAWETPLQIEPVRWGWRGSDGTPVYYLVRSADPDRRFNTGDDLTVTVSVTPGRRSVTTTNEVVTRGGTVDLKIEHDMGPVTGFAEIAGTVVDQTGAIIPNAVITLKQSGASGTRTAHANAAAQFDFAAVPMGSYRVEIAAPGFLTASAAVTVRPRDRAVLSATLAIGDATQTVEVASMNAIITVDAVMAAPVGHNLGMAGAMGGPLMMKNAPQAQGLMVLNAATIDVNGTAQLPITGRSFALKMKTPAPASPEIAAHVRSWFPEALYINPEILTDGHGDATISIPIADSITTWRMAMVASTRAGALGTGTSSLKVFQDFFVDLDLPVTLTQGDRVSIPIGIYNYSGSRGEVSLKLQQGNWFSLDSDTADKTLNVDSGHVGSSQFTVAANKIGKFKLTLLAHMNGANGQPGRDDIIVREIEVIPNGREQNTVFNGHLDHSVAHDLSFPADAIPDASSVLVRLYPGPLSQVIEGMDSILSMPGGCFEQTSSSTYPNVLALDYMKRTKKLTPEVHAKAEGFIANGYQRLLTFEVPGGGFSWFGQAPANKILTAYGLMEFTDMSKVSDVDHKVIDRTRDWLISQQQTDGSWKPDTQFINEGATNRYNTNVLRITAYIAWALANTGYQGPTAEKAKQFIEAHSSEKPDTYTLAVIANFAVDYGKDRDFTNRSMQALLDARTEKDDQVFWSAEETSVYSTGASAAIETTGLAVQALLKWGHASEPTRKALSYISSKKQASGNWGTTQATIMALRALLFASQFSASDVHGTVHISLNGKLVQTLELTKDNNDLLHQFVFKGEALASGGSSDKSNRPTNVQVSFEGSGGLAYQVVGRYFTPWEAKPLTETLSIDVTYDQSKLAQNDIATATATIHNNLSKTATMIMVDLGIPPGFDLLSEDLQSFQEKTESVHGGKLEKFSLTATQAILYFDALAPNQTVALKLRLRAKYPIRAHTFQSRVYEYYAPDINATARPIKLEITPR